MEHSPKDETGFHPTVANLKMLIDQLVDEGKGNYVVGIRNPNSKVLYPVYRVIEDQAQGNEGIVCMIPCEDMRDLGEKVAFVIDNSETAFDEGKDSVCICKAMEAMALAGHTFGDLCLSLTVYEEGKMSSVPIKVVGVSGFNGGPSDGLKTLTFLTGDTFNRIRAAEQAQKEKAQG